MTTFEITYIRTGSGERKNTTKVWINTGDYRKDLSVIHNITDAIEYFEELAEEWGTFENRNAIINIKVSEF